MKIWPKCARVCSNTSDDPSWTREGLLVAIDDVRFVVLHLAEPDEALARELLAGIGDFELLEIRVEPGAGPARVSLLNPLVEILGGARVDVIAGVSVSWRSPRITRTRL